VDPFLELGVCRALADAAYGPSGQAAIKAGNADT
jgi:hypothetical protein